MAKLTKKGARQITSDLDRIAELIQGEYETLGIPRHIAHDFALKCDMLSDAIERVAGLSREALTGYDPVKEQGFDPENIGEESAGPMVDEPDEPFMKGEFSQQENRELREKQQAGELGPDKTTEEPQKPTPGVQAAFKGLIAALKAGDIGDEGRVAKALHLATRVVKESKGKVPPEFLEQQKKNKSEDKDEDEEKKAKKARFDHGYRLDA